MEGTQDLSDGRELCREYEIWKTKSKFQFPFFRDKARLVENFKGASWKLNRNRGNRYETVLAV